jgi:hypothetical protein
MSNNLLIDGLPAFIKSSTLLLLREAENEEQDAANSKIHDEI